MNATATKAKASNSKQMAIEKAETSIVQPGQLLEKAIEKGLDIDALEKLVGLHERWEAKQAMKSFHDAMNQFQANKPKLVKKSIVDYTTKTGTKIKYNFNPLPKIQEVVDPVLSQFGLSYKWKQEQLDGGLIKITCVVSHVDGYSEETHLQAVPDNSGSKNPVQAIGSTVQYLRRYTLENALGLSSDEDTDGRGGKPTTEKTVPTTTQWGGIVKKYRTGEVTMEEILEHFTLTDQQATELDALG